MAIQHPAILTDWMVLSATHLPVLGVALFLAVHWLTVATALSMPRALPSSWRGINLMLVMTVGVLGWVKWGVEPDDPLKAWLALACIASLGGWLGLVTAAGAGACTGFRLRSVAGIAFGISLVWVANYRYQYNVPALNSPYFNLSTLSIWGTCLSCTAVFNRMLCRREWHWLPRYGLVWMAYMTGLVILEFIGYHVLAIKEVSKGVFHSPMMFDLVHGPIEMKAFYLMAGVLVAGLDQTFRRVAQIRRARQCPRANETDLNGPAC